MSRFSQEILPIRDLCLVVLLHALLKGLRSGPFADSLARRPPESIDELRRRAAEYINMEDIFKTRQSNLNELAVALRIPRRRRLRRESGQRWGKSSRAKHDLNALYGREGSGNPQAFYVECFSGASILRRHQSKSDQSQRCLFHQCF